MNYKTAAEKTDEAERLLTPPFKKTDAPIDSLMDTVQQLRDKLALSEASHKKLAEELPLMRKENKRLTRFLQDAAAFVQHNTGNSKTWSDRLILSTLIHDITGLAKDEPCFLPRVTGYSQKGKH
jgi:hypothetical protein